MDAKLCLLFLCVYFPIIGTHSEEFSYKFYTKSVIASVKIYENNVDITIPMNNSVNTKFIINYDSRCMYYSLNKKNSISKKDHYINFDYCLPILRENFLIGLNILFEENKIYKHTSMAPKRYECVFLILVPDVLINTLKKCMYND